jgi:hypothetical protein
MTGGIVRKLTELVLAHNTVIGLVRIANPIGRLVDAGEQESDNLKAALPRPGDTILGIADLLAESIEM